MKARYDDLDEYIADLKAEIAENEQCAKDPAQQKSGQLLVQLSAHQSPGKAADQVWQRSREINAPLPEIQGRRQR